MRSTGLLDHHADEQRAGRGREDDFLFVTRFGRPFSRQNISEGAIAKAARRAGLGDGIRAHTLRRSFCTFVAESAIAPHEAAALTGHDERVWWRHYVQPRRDEQTARDNVAKLVALGLGMRSDVDQPLTSDDGSPAA